MQIVDASACCTSELTPYTCILKGLLQLVLPVVHARGEEMAEILRLGSCAAKCVKESGQQRNAWKTSTRGTSED